MRAMVRYRGLGEMTFTQFSSDYTNFLIPAGVGVGTYLITKKPLIALLLGGAALGGWFFYKKSQPQTGAGFYPKPMVDPNAGTDTTTEDSSTSTPPPEDEGTIGPPQDLVDRINEASQPSVSIPMVRAEIPLRQETQLMGFPAIPANMRMR